MKKFAALFICVLMVLSMVAVGITSVSAAASGNDGVLNVYKKSDTEAAEGQTLNDNDPATKKSLGGATFTIYKVFEKTDNGYVIQQEFATDLASYTDTLTKANNAGDTFVTYGSTTDLQNQVGKAVVAAAQITDDSKKIVRTTANETGLATFDNLDYGVYLVVETNPPSGYTAVSQPFFVNIKDGTAVDTYPKNEPFPFEKEIGTAAEHSTTASYSIGDTVPYIVTTKTPAYNTQTLDALFAAKHGKDVEGGTTEDPEESGMFPDTIDDYNGYIPYVFTDNLSKGLTLVKGTTGTDAEKLKAAFTVTIDGNTFTNFTVTEANYSGSNTDYTDGKTYTISFRFDKIYATDDTNAYGEAEGGAAVNLLNKDVVITYNAVLNENARVDGDAATVKPNKNDIDLQFKNDPSSNSTPITYEPPKGDPEVFTYEMDLTKKLNGEAFSFDSTRAGEQKPVFKLYTVTTSGSEKGISVQSTATAGVYTVANDEAAAANVADLTVADDGTLKLRGLAAGTYYLAETTAPVINGTSYTPLAGYIQITVTDTVVDGKITGDVEATINSGAGTTIAHTNEGTFSFDVNNPKSQFELPTTGGMGILIFTLGAAVVLALAIVLFTVARKKKS